MIHVVLRSGSLCDLFVAFEFNGQSSASSNGQFNLKLTVFNFPNHNSLYSSLMHSPKRNNIESL